MRNIDKIRKLEHELGRYRKKVADQDKLIMKLRDQLDEVHAGAIELQNHTDALLTVVARQFGEMVTDEETMEELGRRLRLPPFDTADVRRRYEIHARRDAETGDYIVGVVPRGGADTEASAHQNGERKSEEVTAL